MAPYGAPDNDRKAKESSWLVSQAFIEGLRYYPQGQQAMDSNDCQATYSGNTHNKKSFAFEHMESDLRSRLDIAPGASHHAPSHLCYPAHLSHRSTSLARVLALIGGDPRAYRVAADTEWREEQLPREWVPEKRNSMLKHMAKTRERLKR